jgi:hypothetical protein
MAEAAAARVEERIRRATEALASCRQNDPKRADLVGQLWLLRHPPERRVCALCGHELEAEVD